MNSLRTRIAIYYGTLIVAMIVVAAIALNFAFRQILLDQAKLRVNATSDQIVKQIVQNDNLSFAEPEPVLVTLGDRANLDHWAGPSTYVQIDSLAHYLGSLYAGFDDSQNDAGQVQYRNGVLSIAR